MVTPYLPDSGPMMQRIAEKKTSSEKETKKETGTPARGGLHHHVPTEILVPEALSRIFVHLHTPSEPTVQTELL
jgi:hypothetical protein